MDEKNAILMTILNDADMAVLTAGGTVIAYGKPFAFAHRLQQIVAFTDIYFITPGVVGTLKVWADFSLDGVNYKAFANDLLGNTTATGVARGNVNTDVADYGPLVRINVSFTTTGAVGAARLSVVAALRFY